MTKKTCQRKIAGMCDKVAAANLKNSGHSLKRSSGLGKPPPPHFYLVVSLELDPNSVLIKDLLHPTIFYQRRNQRRVVEVIAPHLRIPSFVGMGIE